MGLRYNTGIKKFSFDFIDISCQPYPTNDAQSFLFPSKQLLSALELLGDQNLESIGQLPNGLAVEEEQHNFGIPWAIVHWLAAEHGGNSPVLGMYVTDREVRMFARPI
jgi:hypothetical protein